MFFFVVSSDKTLHKISRKIGAKRVALGMELDLDYCDVETLQCRHSDPVDHAFQTPQRLHVNVTNSDRWPPYSPLAPHRKMWSGKPMVYVHFA